MITCSNCQHQEFAGALFCSECGAQFVFPDYLQDPPPAASPAEKILLSILGSGAALPLPETTEITLGRAGEGQSILPDIDLSAYQAYEAGVSRLHVSINRIGQQLAVSDLGSANGTRVNGEKIKPHMPHHLNHGDILTLGKLKIQVLFQSG